MRQAAVHHTVVDASHGGDLAAALAGASIVLFVVLLGLVAVLIGRYRSECHQLRERNRQLSMENDRWHEDFAAQTGELTALRHGSTGTCGYQLRPHAEAS